MGLLGGILGLPLAPIKLVISLGQVIQQQVDRETHSPESVRADLEEIEEAREEGRILPDDEERQEQEVIDRMTGRPGRRSAARSRNGGRRPIARRRHRIR